MPGAAYWPLVSRKNSCSRSAFSSCTPYSATPAFAATSPICWTVAPTTAILPSGIGWMLVISASCSAVASLPASAGCTITRLCWDFRSSSSIP